MFKRIAETLTAADLYQFIVLGMLFVMNMCVFFATGMLNDILTGAIITACVGIGITVATKEK